MGRDEDAALAHAIANSDEDAATTFDQRFRAKVETFVRRRKVLPLDCADVTQEVLTEALRQLRRGQFRAEATLGTWLHPIIHGRVTDYFRRRGGPELVSLDDVTVDHAALIATSDGHAVLGVRQALSRLSSADRFLLVLYHQQGHTLEEIGPLLGLRKSAVAVRLKKAEEQFRIALRGGGRNPDGQRLRD